MSNVKPKLVVLSDKTSTNFCRELARLQSAVTDGFEVEDAGFDSWLREIFEPTARSLADEAAILAFFLSPRVLDLPDAEQLAASLLEGLDRLSPARTILFSNFTRDPRGPAPLLLHDNADSLLRRMNSALYSFASSRPWMHVVDQSGFLALEGLSKLTDLRFESSAQMYFSPAGQKTLAMHWNRPVSALQKVPAKVLVTDLDNTLWRGVLGEDGPQGIDMGSSPAGWPYMQYQKSLRVLKERGILLAVASKNNRDEVLELLTTHPDAQLRPADFAALEISWSPKSESLRQIAKSLNLGLDSLVFIDDSSFEREEVSQALPMVRVLAFPSEVSNLADVIFASTAFDALKITKEDAERAASYTAEAQRNELRRGHSSAADFYSSLQLKLEISVVNAGALSRVHQLVLKTNQFNLTTERLSDSELRARISSGNWLCLGLRVSDKFGDSGLTGVAFVDVASHEHWVVANFLLSCRVIGRTVENAFVDWLARRAAAAGASALTFAFSRNDRNIVAAEFLERSGLIPSADASRWTATLSDIGALAPNYVQVSFGEPS